MANRYVIVDYMHLAYKCMNTPQLSTRIQQPQGIVEVDTTVPNFTIKDIFRYSSYGQYPVAVCLEGGGYRRAEHFAKIAPVAGKKGQYKGTRDNAYKSVLHQGCDLAIDIMHRAGVSLYRRRGLEADDLIYNLVRNIKRVDPVTPIDVITNDADLLPLVDDQVSVYKRSTTLSHSEGGAPSLRGYYQVTPFSWDNFLAKTSEFRDFFIPYNSLLLYKLIRGDKSDNIPAGERGYGPVKYSALMEQMILDGIDLNIFNYHSDRVLIEQVLLDYFKPESVARMMHIYDGVNFFEAEGLNLPKRLDLVNLRNALLDYKIKLPY